MKEKNMNEILLNLKSQLIYVLENQLKLKEEFFLREFGTPDSPEIIDDYFNKISDKIVLILENNYSFVNQLTIRQLFFRLSLIYNYSKLHGNFIRSELLLTLRLAGFY